MSTRLDKNEMVYDFMVALASNPNIDSLVPLDIKEEFNLNLIDSTEKIHMIANRLLKHYLENLY